MIFKKKKKQPRKNIHPSLVTALREELNEPISALNGLHDLLLKTKLTKEQRRYVSASIDSTFKLSQTIQTMTELSAEEVAKSVDKGIKFQSPTSECHALIIESEALSARIFKHTLSKFELKHRIVHNLPEAITELEDSLQSAEPFTHILVDEALHSVTAKESIEYIKAVLKHTTHRPKLILTSRNLRNRSHDRILSYGYNAVLTKPLRETSLLAYLTHKSVVEEKRTEWA